ncbi:MAG: diguanylate cyclase/phosphodiesterase (GGDEF & EAL domains) with PAS/PAC sensor(s) [uncultured Rubrobacteraceae bacterium]|uniref:Diguanylate cyclase/phosphodiesterase (GGDEF & EAL domains) with PAS/PAC sensor(S) n=1 Tax=uncultured Rubrobacteraceae bacterium TaxID=349277 RepID=A0A6J4QGE6_9ACTN|nr:MAG: diguanylate cyclase/phosphodiesterase (GGDEF & EAL domains) with PAS/PAC sensor(s) [uncultured Rubrobacteraceae bacterium]
MNGRRALEGRGQDRRDAEIARLKREVEVLRERERAARAEAEDARKHFSELTAMSKRFAISMRAGTGERQQYRRRLASQYAVSRVLAEARDLDEAAPRIFEILGERLGWQLGVLWTVDGQAGVLRRAGIWRSSEASPGAMEEACEAIRLRRGESLPGRVWEREEPVWVEDVLEDGYFLRNGAAEEDGLHGAFAFPIKEGGFVGVFELFRREVLPPDEDLLRTAGLIGDQIGQFLERRRAEEERDLSLARERAARREASDILESINDAFFALDHERRFTYVNRKAEQFWDRTREKLLGKNIWEEFPQAVGSENYQRIEKAFWEGEAAEFETMSPVLHAWIVGRVYPSSGGISMLFHSIEERKRAEEAIRESEERYRSLAEATSSIVWTGAGDGTCTEEMPAWEEFTGQTFEEYRGFGWLDAVHPEDRPPRNAWEELAAAPAPTEVVYRMRRHDGEYRRVVSRGVPIFDESGGVREYIGTINDVEDHRRAEEALRESEERLHTVIENAPLALFATDRKGVFTLVRGQALESMGIDGGELLGLSVFDLYADEPDAMVNMRRALAGETFVADVTFASNAALRGRVLQIYYNPVHDADGEVTGMTGVATDVTERRRAERERARLTREVASERARLEVVLRQMPAGVFITDASGEVILSNKEAERVYGKRVEAIEECIQHTYSYPDGEEIPTEQYPLVRSLRHGETITGEEHLIRREDGTAVVVNVNCAPARDEEERVVAVVKSFYDVTWRKEAEEALRESEERLRTIVENAPVVLFALDREGIYTLLRGRGLEALGLDQNQLVGRSVFEVYADHTGMLKNVRRALSGEVFTAVTEVDDLILETGYTPIRDRSGALVSVIGVATDITERKKAESERDQFLAAEWRARAEAEERKRISRELHDRVAHSMGVVHQSLELYEAFKERNPEQAETRIRLARETTREALDLTRNLSRELHDVETRNGLSAALSNLLKTAVPPGLESSIHVKGDEALIPPRIREQLFLILREAVRNAVSHGGAKYLKVGVEARPEKVVGYVEDDGRGFKEAPEGDGSGRGIDSMRERAELVDGAFRLSSTQGTGTKIEASIPLNAGRIGGVESYDGGRE